MKMRISSRLLLCIACLACLIEKSFAQNEGDLRLTNGTSIYGWLEIYYNSTWSTISDEYMDFTIYRVACRQLGLPFTEAEPVRDKSVFRPASSETSVMVLAPSRCHGNELRLMDCPTFDGQLEYNYTHDHDIAVFCIGDFLPTGELRLVHGSDNIRGRLEIYTGTYLNEWLPFCKRAFDFNESVVACRQLGFNTSQDFQPGVSYFSYGSSGLFSATDRYIAHCTGDEETINSCDQHYLSGLSNNSYERYCNVGMDVELCCPLTTGACDPPSQLREAVIGSIFIVVFVGAICVGCCIFCRGRCKKNFKPPKQYKAVSQKAGGECSSNQIPMDPVGESDLPVYVHDQTPAKSSPLPVPVVQPHKAPPSSTPTNMSPSATGGSTPYPSQPDPYPTGQVAPPVGAYPPTHQPGFNPTAAASMQFPSQQVATYPPQPAVHYPPQQVAPNHPPQPIYVAQPHGGTYRPSPAPPL